MLIVLVKHRACTSSITRKFWFKYVMEKGRIIMRSVNFRIVVDIMLITALLLSMAYLLIGIDNHEWNNIYSFIIFISKSLEYMLFNRFWVWWEKCVFVEVERRKYICKRNVNYLLRIVEIVEMFILLNFVNFVLCLQNTYI